MNDKYQPYTSCKCNMCTNKGFHGWLYKRKRINKDGLTQEERDVRSARKSLAPDRKWHKTTSHRKLRRDIKLALKRGFDTSGMHVSTGYIM